jgi:hypothetical protein
MLALLVAVQAERKPLAPSSPGNRYIANLGKLFDIAQPVAKRRECSGPVRAAIRYDSLFKKHAMN